MSGFGLGKNCSKWLLIVVLALAYGARTCCAQVPVLDGFSWVDLKSDTGKVAAVTKALEQQKYTALREIAVANDAALVITTTRDNPQAQPEFDHFNVYSVSLKDGSVQPLLAASRLRLLDWERFTRDGQSELLATYDDCTNCRATTFLTAFYIDPRTSLWNARWQREKSGAPLAAQNTGAPGDEEHIYALLGGSDGRVVLGTWQHFQSQRSQSSDYLFEYLVDSADGQEFSRPLLGNDAKAMKFRLCQGGDQILGIAGGQNSAICPIVLHGHPVDKATSKSSRRPSHRHRRPTSMAGQSDPAHPHR
jgi:hypothetical protein